MSSHSMFIRHLHNIRHVRLLWNNFIEAAEIISVADIFLFQHWTTVWEVLNSSYRGVLVYVNLPMSRNASPIDNYMTLAWYKKQDIGRHTLFSVLKATVKEVWKLENTSQSSEQWTMVHRYVFWLTRNTFCGTCICKCFHPIHANSRLLLLQPFLRYTGSQNLLIGHVTPARTPTDLICIFFYHLWPIALYMFTELELSSFSRSWDIGGSQNVKLGHVTPTTTPTGLIYIFLFRAPSPL